MVSEENDAFVYSGPVDGTRAGRTYRTEGIVLRQSDSGEADRIVVLFTPFRGKVRAVAKGARKPTSRLAGHLEPFTHTSVFVVRGRNLDIITQAQTVRPFIEIREDLRRMVYASYASELVDRFTDMESENRPLFDLLYAMLAHLIIGRRPDTLLRAFELGVLDALGYRPQLEKCVVCGLPAGGGYLGFSPSAGGLLCAEDRASQRDQREISLAALRVLRRLQADGLPAAEQIRMAPDVRDEVEGIMGDDLRYHLESDINSADVLHAIRRQAAMLRDSPPAAERPNTGA